MDESKPLGGDQDLRTSTLIRQRTNSRRKSSWFSWRIRTVSSTISRLVSGCRWSNSLFLVHVRKIHIPPSRWTQSQALLAERRIIPCSTEVHRCIQNYSYEFGCQAKKTHRWLLEYRWVKRFLWFLDRFHSVYSIRRETSRRIYVVRGRLTRRQITSRPDHLLYDSKEKQIIFKDSIWTIADLYEETCIDKYYKKKTIETSWVK